MKLFSTALLVFLLPVTALAHRAGESYIFLRVDQSGLTGRVEISLKDLHRAMELDTSGDGELSPEEFKAAHDKVLEYLKPKVAIGANGQNFPLEWTGPSLYEDYIAQVNFTVNPPGPLPDVIEAEYSGFFDLLEGHSAYLVTEANYKTGLKDNEALPSLIFSEDEPRRELDLNEPVTRWTILDFIREGIRHIWIGLDHVLFVISLVVASVLVRKEGRWQPVESFRSALINILTVITIFTVAHSVTLSMAALQLVDLSARWVESIIALSVALAALNNLVPIFNRWVWGIVFLFGLFHGFGFASVLGHLTQARTSIIQTLLGFNIGVEIGQVAIILVVFPLCFLLRKTAFYRWGVLVLGSLVIIAIAVVWFVERAFELG